MMNWRDSVALLLRIEGFILRILPKCIFYCIATLLGYIWFYIIPIRRGVALENVMRCLNVSERDARRIVLNSMINIATSFLEFIAQRDVIITYRNYEEFESIKNEGGVIATAHTGNWDVLESVAIREGVRLGVISRKSGIDALNRFLETIRKERGETIFEEDTPISQLLKFLRDGGFLGIVIDQNMPPRRGRPATFFSQRVNTTFAPQIISIRTGLPILPAFIRRVQRERFEVVFYSPHRPADDSDRGIENSMNYLNNLLMDFIRLYPDQWLWVHKRFKPLRQ